jgi:geranylgeranyl diphosphate synthase, type II
VSVMPSSGLDAPELLRRHAQVLADHFKTLGGRFPGAPRRLFESIEYSLMAGGKRLRPALVFECWRACGGDGAADTPALPHSVTQSRSQSSNSYPSALAAAAAIELIHTFSLVHDDLPAMDDDDLRRGRPTNHKVFGEAMAILAGDAMVMMAFELLARDAQPGVLPALVQELASASGPEGMIGGQVLDIDSENISLKLDQLQRLHGMKTGALLTASCRLGAIAAGASELAVTAVTQFGKHLGLAFQIVDDLLDVTSTPEQLGKATRKDAGKGKNTYPTLLGMEASQREADAQLDAALKAVEVLGSNARTLGTLAQFVVKRDK